MTAFSKAEASPSFPALETEVLRFWDERDIYRRSLAARAGSPRFVFYEGPPTANGKPHPGHCLTRAIKDLFPRYKTMRGYLAERKAGWDTHGLPVEVEVGKELDLDGRQAIVDYGVEPFVQKCQQSVFRYINEWHELTRRLGFWVDLENEYVTYHQSYVESVWWSLKNLFDRGLLYEGHRIVWWWAQGGTALSAAEVGQGYREVDDPSVYVLFPLRDDSNRSLVVWTTTPWTLPSNQYAAVRGDLTYAIVDDAQTGHQLIVASDLVETLAGKLKRDLPVVEKVSGTELVGKRYQPPFDMFVKSTGDPVGRTAGGDNQHLYWRVVDADFVTTESGTGIVHLAPAFGETDYAVHSDQAAGFTGDATPQLLHCVGPDGRMTEAAGEFAGLWVKDADRPIIQSLKVSGRLLHQEQYRHDYPFCWRAKDDPLIQYPRDGWFLRTTLFREAMLANNAQINWLPEHIRDGRFGKFLESNVDWALSRERFWGTPLPIWRCESTGQIEAIGGYDELLAKPGVDGTQVWDAAKAANPELVDDLRVHRPYIDAVTYDSPFASGGRMVRVPEVIDCWYDAGSMPFAQWGWPHQGDDSFQSQFPADFISEALDQTRGWFYTQLAISTMLFGEHAGVTGPGGSDRSGSRQDFRPATGSDRSIATESLGDFRYGGATPPAVTGPHPFRNCIVLGLMLGEDGQKMSKQDRNYREPREIFDKYGADALRWFFYSGQPPWTAIRYQESQIKNSIPELLLRLWNVYSFFSIYAQIDGFDPAGPTVDDQLSAESFGAAAGRRPVPERSEIDRWMISELHRTTAAVTEAMDGFDNFTAASHLHALVDAASNWYVRRSRSRFWSDADSPDPSMVQDKADAQWTLYETLLHVAKLLAPFTPFLSETLWQRLAAPLSGTAVDSVHLCDYPAADPTLVDANLSGAMGLLREIASLGRAARADAKLKVRQPLAGVRVILGDDQHTDWLSDHAGLIAEELNVKEVTLTTDGGGFVDYAVVPNFKALGPKVGKRMPLVKKLLAAADGNALLSQLRRDGKVTLDVDGQSVDLTDAEIEVRLSAREGWAAAQGVGCVVILSTEVTEELRREGIAKDLIRSIQATRKAIDCGFTDRIEVACQAATPDVAAAIEVHGELIRRETLADSLVVADVPETATDSEHGRIQVTRRDN